MQFVKQFTDKDQIIVGQKTNDESQLDIQLDASDVSAIHCLFEKRGDQLYVCDLGSVSGTFKNGKSVVDELVGPGDEVSVGSYKIVFLTMPVAKPAVEAVTSVTTTVESAVKEVKKEVVVEPVIIPETPKVVEKPLVSRPTIPAQFTAQRGSVSNHLFKTKKTKNFKTFAPGNAHSSLSEFIRVGKGESVQVITSWKGRVLDTKSLKVQGSYKAGVGADIQLPQGTLSQTLTLVDCASGVTVHIPQGAKAEVKKDQETLALEGNHYKLQQNEVVYLRFANGIELGIRHISNSKIIALDSPLMLTSSELTGILCALILASLTSLIVSVYTPKEKPVDEEVQRVAQVIFNKPPVELPKTPPPPPPPPEKVEAKQEEPPKPEEKKVVQAAKTAAESQSKGDPSKPDAKAQQAQKAGRASEVKPKDPNLKAKMFTSTKQGGAIKTGNTAGANAKSKEPDPTNAGLLAAFGGGGARSKLDKAYSGSGELLGAGEKATGSSGFSENRVGDDLGSKFKDTGAGGKGTATQGIAGVGTKGRGTGMSAFGSGDGLGSKDQVSIVPGGAEEEFVGSIDREAVRRAVRSAMPAFRACYEREYKKDTKLEGKVVISWEIHEKGVGKNSKVVHEKSTIGNRAVEECVRERILALRYPEPPAGTVAEVMYPFLFQGQK